MAEGAIFGAVEFLFIVEFVAERAEVASVGDCEATERVKFFAVEAGEKFEGGDAEDAEGSARARREKDGKADEKSGHSGSGNADELPEVDQVQMVKDVGKNSRARTATLRGRVHFGGADAFDMWPR